MTAYRDHIKKGPFPDRCDPFAESGRYFQSIHSGIIDHLIIQMQDTLLDKRYLIGKETSLHAEGRQPDVFIERQPTQRDQPITWDYAALAEKVQAEPGIAVDAESDLQAVHISQAGDLVTIIEVISPRNKTEPDLVAQYRERRERLIHEKAVNVVEIDLTRSVKRLLDTPLTGDSPYHVAVFLPNSTPRIIGMAFDTPLKRIAVPLRADVIPIELQDAYTYGYQLATIAGHIHHEGRYTLDDLPFPSLINAAQHSALLQKAQDWAKTLRQLESSP